VITSDSLRSDLVKISIILIFSGMVFVNLVLAEEKTTQVQKISARIIILKINDTNITAISAEKGVVVIDTGNALPQARIAKKIIEENFPGEKIAFVINTHGDYDHTFGNQIFSDAMIIGHSMCEEWMSRTTDDEKFKMQIKSYPPLKDFISTPPNLTFTERLTLHLGNITMKLRYYGIAHTNSDILIEVPEEKLLIVGDLFFAKGLPGMNIHEGKYNPGSWDVPKWIENLNKILDGKTWNHIVSGHGDFIPQRNLALWRDYIQDLWGALQKAHQRNAILKDIKNSLSLEKRFEYLKEMGYTQDELEKFHSQTMKKFWDIMD
jgi:glyoxylase-like metal-dependent hydrolase (beta-lactamase superfamily II)